MNRKIINLTYVGLLVLALTACAVHNTEPTLTPTQSVSPVATATPTPEPIVEAPATPKPFAFETTNEAGSWNGHKAYYMERQIVQPESLPPSLVGKVFDKEGNPLTLYPDGSVIYDENGNEGLIRINSDSVNTFFPVKYAPLEITDELREAARLFCSDLYFPAYIPDGYSLQPIDSYDIATTPIDEMCTKTMLFKRLTDNNKTEMLAIGAFHIPLGAAGEARDDGVQWITIRGNKAYIRYDDDYGYVAFMIDDVSYYISGKGITKDDALNIAYSMTLVEVNPED